MLDALECGHEVTGADRGTLVLGGHQCGFGPDGAHFGTAFERVERRPELRHHRA